MSKERAGENSFHSNLYQLVRRNVAFRLPESLEEIHLIHNGWEDDADPF